MIENLMPSSVACVHSFTDRFDTPLFPQEEAVIARAVAKRRAEFTTVRACARDALAKLGHPPVPILPGERDAPGWPDGVVGSMTHCQGYRAAVVARAGEVAALGIDAEPDAPLPDGMLESIARPEDLAALAALPTGGPAWGRLLFSAKESVYKAWFPVGRRLLDFQDASVTILPDGTFTARVLVPAPHLLGSPLNAFSGRWTAGNGLLLTSIAVQP
ncbi:4'-phosphopantetheinyl transferase superfamily protein [Streptomyces sp. CNQ085]|uniref:4'-phosphopantetheinyl transferase family protein n=1 Tax=Streptomyces sp. CNQ085 TaxID=2886944 RepID=UPI001F50A427|nr:4'-phosphopantetheinyl transferase superfamily protein [Streptomyces sp. CNQ085]MCI0385679.1 4'-phosphopantetheinyl transferase superfamily protein [Streptomyces sp. CNQ085]